MGIIRTSTTRVLAPYADTFRAVTAALVANGNEITDGGNPLRAQASRSLTKNRWAAQIAAGVRPESPTTTVVEWTVDMLGDKHREVMDDLFAAMPIPLDDLGLQDAVNRLGKLGRFAGAREIRVLSHLLDLDERALEIGQGQYTGKQGIVVLTTKRLMFVDRSALGMGTRTEAFDIHHINSIGLVQKRTGEQIDVSISGRSAQIDHLIHGRGEAIVNAFRRAKADLAGAAAAPPVSPAIDPVDQIRRLAELRDQGVLTSAEFDAKKAELLGRM